MTGISLYVSDFHSLPSKGDIRRIFEYLREMFLTDFLGHGNEIGVYFGDKVVRYEVVFRPFWLFENYRVLYITLTRGGREVKASFSIYDKENGVIASSKPLPFHGRIFQRLIRDAYSIIVTTKLPSTPYSKLENLIKEGVLKLSLPK